METWRLIYVGASGFFLLLTFIFLRDGRRYRRRRARQQVETQEFLSRAVCVPGVVVGAHQETERFYAGPYNNKKLRIFYPVVQFQTAQGQPVETRVEVGIEGIPPPLGQQLEVCYDSAQPLRSRLRAGIYPPRFSWRGVSGCMMTGFACMYIGLAVLGILLAIFVPG